MDIFLSDSIDTDLSAQNLYNDFKETVSNCINGDLENFINLICSTKNSNANYGSLLNVESLENLQKLHKLNNLIYLMENKTPSVYTKLSSYNISSLIEAADAILHYWSFYTLKVNDHFDIYVENENKWYYAKILTAEVDEQGALKYIYIHYDGWPDKFNTTVDISDARVAPGNTYTKQKKKKPAAKPKKNYVIMTTVVNAEENNNSNNNENDILKSSSVELTGFEELTQFGRVLKKKVDSFLPFKSSPKKREPKEEKDKNDWVCSICDFMEDEADSVLILCDGDCLRSFHENCLKQKYKQKADYHGDKWFCEDCVSGVHMCFICLNKGKDYSEVNRCSFANCGKYYHRECLESPPDGMCVSTEVSEVEKVLPSSNQKVQTFSFKCPRHKCDTCFPCYGTSSGGSDLNQCIRCPRSFHNNCIPPGSRYNSLCLMCPRHPRDVLPSNDVPRKRKIGDISSNISSTSNAFQLIWDQLFLPEVFPDPENVQDTHFKLQSHLKDEVDNAPQQWKHISKNDYDTLDKAISVPQYRQEGGCDCVDLCGPGCFNRVLTIECCNLGTRSLCQVGPDCSNRPIQNKMYADTEVFREPNMGWGLRAKSFIPDGALVIEYVGEIIDFNEAQRRMASQRENHPSDKDFYIMELDNNLYVDGKFRGNNSRFINHSCDPNCELQRWVVNGSIRIGIFAIKDIPKGEPLSYDYQFDTNEADVFKCYCGAETCRGTMASKKKKRILTNGSVMNQADRMMLILAGKNKEKKMTMKYKIEDELSRSYTGKFLPGDAINEVKNGPNKAMLSIARQNRILLPRNVNRIRGMMLKRRNRFLSR